MLRLKKSLGQNLLIDKNILKKIVSITSLYNKEIIEIGPGTGNLTKEILKAKPKKIARKNLKFLCQQKKISTRGNLIILDALQSSTCVLL